MAVPAQVSLIGVSQADLNLQAAVLHHFWAIKTVALDAGEEPRFDSELVVICASINGPDQQVWVDRARHAMPQVLIIRVDGFDSGPLAGADATVDHGHGPAALVSTIYELLTERGLESRAWPIDAEVVWVQ